jgi:hypothetical protein
MLSHPAKMKRFTQFFNDDDDDDRGPEPLPLASNQESDRPPQLDDITALPGLVTSRTVQADQETVRTPSLHGSSTVEAQMRPDIPIRTGSLRHRYKLVHKRDLGGTVEVVLELPTGKDVYLVRELSVAKDEVSSFRKRRLFHENLCRTHEVFEDSGVFYCVMEPAVVTLRHVYRCPGYPNEDLLVAITKQVRLIHTQLSSAADVTRCLLESLT